MKFTNSKDGEKRATIRVPYRIGRSEMHDLVAYALIRDNEVGNDLADGTADPNDLPRLTRTRVEEMVRWTLHRAGHESYGYWSDDCTAEAIDALETWVIAEIDRLFPELS